VTVSLTGATLGLADVVDVARNGTDVRLDDGALERMRAARTVVETALARGDDVYGLTTGLGVSKDRRLDEDRAAASQWDLVRAHLVGQGPPFAPEVVRAAALLLANGFASGRAGVRPEIAQRLVDALNVGRLPDVPTLGSVGQADLAPLAHLAADVLGGVDLAPGEALALISGNAFATGHATFVVEDAGSLLDAADAAAAASLEGFYANLSPLHPGVADVRPFAGVVNTLERLRAHLEGSSLWEPGAVRNLQDPLSFRDVVEVHGAAKDAFAFASVRVAGELNAAQQSPIVLSDEGEIVSVAAFDAQGLAIALDLLRIGLAPLVLASSERAVKLLDASWSGLPRGLVHEDVDGLSYLGIAVQALAAEAKLLAAPVSFELASTAHAEGIEDRTALAGLAARRADEMLGQAARVLAIELVVAVQAIDVQPERAIGAGVTETRGRVRALVARATAEEPAPPDVEPVVDLVRSWVRADEA
jgi:histidine ammonia-lyase